MTEQQQHSYADELKWQPVWLPQKSILQSKALKVRELDPNTVAAYRKRKEAGELPPPVKVAAVKEDGETRLYLVGGWHRMAAGALITRPGSGGVEVHALAAPMSMPEARLQAVHDNRNHGLPLRSKDRPLILEAYIAAHRHRTKAKAPGQPRGFRSLSEIAAATGIPKTTVHRWINERWPALHRAMAGDQEGNLEPSGGDYKVAPAGRARLDEVLAEYTRLQGLVESLPYPLRDEAIKAAASHHKRIKRADYSTPPVVPLEHLQSTEEGWGPHG